MADSASLASTTATSAGKWLKEALFQLSNNKATNSTNGGGSGGPFWLDLDVISGVVSYCELAPSQDAKEYLHNIIGQEAVQSIAEEYLQRRGYGAPGNNISSSSKVRAYVKPPADEGLITGQRKHSKGPKSVGDQHSQEGKASQGTLDSKNIPNETPNTSRKKKAGRVVSLMDAAKGSVVLKQGKPCSCQARQHKLVSNCLSCGKIVCEQEGEGPCNFCGALVLREGSTYASLGDSPLPLSDAEVAAEAFKSRLVDYDRNSAARTTVIDDQSDYYEIEGNSWLSSEEKENLKKQQQEIEVAELARRTKLVVTFDLVGRKVLMQQNGSSGSEVNPSMQQQTETVGGKELNRIKPNPNIRVCPFFVDPYEGQSRAERRKGTINSLCLEVSGRVQHDSFGVSGPWTVDTNGNLDSWQAPDVTHRGEENLHEMSAIDHQGSFSFYLNDLN